MKLFDEEINYFLESKFKMKSNRNCTIENKKNFYLENQKTSNYKTDDKKLGNILNQHL